MRVPFVFLMAVLSLAVASPKARAECALNKVASLPAVVEKDHAITLFKPTGCENANLAYWSDGYNMAEMEANDREAPNIDPWMSPYFYPHITLKAKVNGREVLAALDNGDASSTLSLTTAHEIGLDTDQSGVSEVDPTPDVLDAWTTKTWIGTVESLALDQEVIKPARLRIRSFNATPGENRGTGTLVKGSRTRTDMILGADFLVAHRVFVSYGQKKVYFSYVGGGPFAAK